MSDNDSKAPTGNASKDESAASTDAGRSPNEPGASTDEASAKAEGTPAALADTVELMATDRSSSSDDDVDEEASDGGESGAQASEEARGVKSDPVTRPSQDAEQSGAVRAFLNALKDCYLRVDPRWLGVLRILLGLLLSVEVLRRWYYARAFYTNDGILPNHFSLFAPMGRDIFSIYHAFSTMGEVSVAFFLTLVVFLLFTVGYKTRLFHVLSMICITSLDVRNLFVENGGVVVLNIMTFYTMFLPLGRRFSVDAVLRSWRARSDQSVLDLNAGRDELRSDKPVYSLTVLLFLMQWAAIYFFNAVHKSGDSWRGGSAFYWFLHQDRIVTALGVWMREHTPFVVYNVLTWGTLVVEGALTALILSPIQQKWARRVATAFILTLHGGIALTCRIGPFSYVMSLFPFILLGREDWALVGRWFGRERRKCTVVFDGDSALAFFFCRLLYRLDPFDRLVFVDSRDEALVPGRIETERLRAPFVVFRAGSTEPRYHEAAVADVLTALPFGLLVAWPFRVPLLRAGLRWLLVRQGEKHEEMATYLGLAVRAGDPASAERALPELSAPGDFRRAVDRNLAVLREAFVLVLFVSVAAQGTVQNPFTSSRLRGLVEFIHKYRPEALIQLFEYPRLLQGWGMFAPEAPFDDGRVVVDGRTADGRKLDPITGEAPDFSLHAERSWGHEQFWCDYQNRIRMKNHTGNRPHFKDYLLNHHKFTRKPEDALVAFDVWWLEDRSPQPGEKFETPLPPAKLLSHGQVKDPGVTPWLEATRSKPGRSGNR